MGKQILLLIMSAFVLAFVSCDGDNKAETVYKLEVDTNSLTFTSEGAVAKTITVTAENIEWNPELNDTDATWLHVEKKDGAVTVTVDDNPETTERTAKFTIVSSNPTEAPSKEIIVTQAGKAITISIDVNPLELAFNVSGGTKFVTVTAENVEWNSAITEGSDWIDIENNAEGISVTAAANNSTDSRQARVAVTADGAEDTIVTITQEGRPLITDTFLVSNLGIYYGDAYEIGCGNYEINITSTGLRDGYWIEGDGTQLILDIISDYPVSYIDPELPSGTYTFSPYSEDGMENFTAVTDFSQLVFYEDGDTLQLRIVSGTFTVERDGQNYIMAFEMLLANGSVFRGSYNAPIKIINPSVLSTLRSDVDFGTISEGGIAGFMGDYHSNGKYYWITSMWGSGVYMDDKGYAHGDGAVLKLELYSDKSDASALVPGTYTLSDSYDAGTAIPGRMSAYGYIIASWYIEIADGKIVNAAPFISGEIVITRNGANYTAEFDTVDDIGNNITGTYEGEFTYRDMTASAAAQKAAGPHIRKNHVRKAHFGKSEEMRMPVIGSRLKLNCQYTKVQ